MKKLVLVLFLLSSLSSILFAVTVSTDVYHSSEQSVMVQDTTTVNASIFRVRGGFELTNDSTTKKLSQVTTWPLRITKDGQINCASITAPYFYGDGSGLSFSAITLTNPVDLQMVSVGSATTAANLSGNLNIIQINPGVLPDGIKISTANINAIGTSGWLNHDGTWSTPTGGGGGVLASSNIVSSIQFDLGSVAISSMTFPSFVGLYENFRSTITIVKMRAIAEYTSTDTANTTMWDIAYSSITSGATAGMTFNPIFTSTTPWIAANSYTSNWFMPDVVTINSGWTIFPRVISIPNGIPPIIRIEFVYIRQSNQ